MRDRSKLEARPEPLASSRPDLAPSDRAPLKGELPPIRGNPFVLPDDVRALALMLPEVSEAAHMGHPDFRVGGKIFATLWPDEERAVVKLSPEMQAVMVEAEPEMFEPVPGSWGRLGSTRINLPNVDERTLRSALLAAWRTVAPAQLVAQYDGLELD